MTLSIQFYTLVAMIVMGAMLGMAVDTYRLLLRVRLRKLWIKYVYDFLFWVIYALALFYTLYWINEGALRIHVFLAVFCGFAMYKALLSAVYIHMMFFVYRLISKVMYFLIKVLKILIFYPTRWSIIKVRWMLVGVLKVIYRLLKFVIRVIYRVLYGFVTIFFRMLPKTVQKRLRLLYYRVYKMLRKIYQGIYVCYSKLKLWRNHYKS